MPCSNKSGDGGVLGSSSGQLGLQIVTARVLFQPAQLTHTLPNDGYKREVFHHHLFTRAIELAYLLRDPPQVKLLTVIRRLDKLPLRNQLLHHRPIRARLSQKRCNRIDAHRMNGGNAH